MKNLVCIIPVSSFESSKTRLSHFLSEDERTSLLKVMLADIVDVVRDLVVDIILVSHDDNVYDYALELGVSFVKEKDHEDNKLNNALLDAISSVKENYMDHDILIIPSDIPLIKQEHIASVKQFESDMIISPSKGGGTNLLCFNSDYDFIPLFGDMSYFRHIEEALTSGMSINLIESFYLSVDINNPEDLGELLLHGVDTKSYDYLAGLDIRVSSNHSTERLNVERNVE